MRRANQGGRALSIGYFRRFALAAEFGFLPEVPNAPPTVAPFPSGHHLKDFVNRIALRRGADLYAK
jgi:hypothetical protein